MVGLGRPGHRDRWPQDLAANLLFGLGFLLLIPVGLVLRRAFGREDLRSTVGSSAFAVAGIVGVAAQLIYVGAKEVAIDPRYCQASTLRSRSSARTAPWPWPRARSGGS